MLLSALLKHSVVISSIKSQPLSAFASHHTALATSRAVAAHSFTQHHHHIASSLPAPPVPPAGLLLPYHTSPPYKLTTEHPHRFPARPSLLVDARGARLVLLPNSPIHPSPLLLHSSIHPRRCLHISSNSARAPSIPKISSILETKM